MLNIPGGWYWPRKKDTLLYSRSDVIKKLRHPLPVNSRGLLSRIKGDSFEIEWSLSTDWTTNHLS